MVYKMFYSNVTDQLYGNLVEAQSAEALYNENVQKFDEVRKEYLSELQALRDKYKGRFTSLMDNIQSIIDSNEFSPQQGQQSSDSYSGVSLGSWEVNI